MAGHASEKNDYDTAVDKSDARAPSEFTLRSYLATAGAALSYFVTVGLLNAFGIFQEYYQSTLIPDHTPFQISWLGTFPTFAVFLFAPAAGILADKVGPTIPITAGSVLLLIAIFMISLCKTYWQLFLAQGVLMGVGMSFVAIPASGIVPAYFVKNRALVSGISVAGSSLGGVIWPIAFDQMLHKDGISFAWSMRIGGFIMMPLLGICILTVKKPVKKPVTVPDEAGTSASLDEATEKPANERPKTRAEHMKVLRTPPFLLLAAGLVVALFGFFTPFFYISTYAVSLGMSPSLAFYFVSIVNGASLFGRVLPGIVADKWGRFNILVVSMATAGVVAFCWTTATSVAGLVVWTIAYGFASGAILSLQIACSTTLADASIASSAVGIIMGSTSLGGLFGSPIAGALLKHGYIALACWSGSLLLAGAVLIGASRFVQDRRIMARV
ncbi:hypothetical protein B0A48_17333 [Cryoendolithus antarcticus]|uniref:Major facilitator superfamily (MFS) profile domain-containing protein n=1 Tax=Cryoendolithus antarcticus TaxID=1507870 RepID=A0A1V8SC87_9PEZI|nr:hypothetical protein B0A48_17333 [Cryoendolithus antarcticus]